MAIEIIVEDGSSIPNANSYVSVADVRLYAANRGITLPVDNDEVAAMLIQATDYLESKACEYQGYPTNVDQSLQWPRTCVQLNGTDFATNAIPKQLKSAQCALVIAVNEGFPLLPNTNAANYVVEETVGPITTKYADPTKVGVAANFAAADALLAPLFGKCAGMGIRTIRV